MSWRRRLAAAFRRQADRLDPTLTFGQRYAIERILLIVRDVEARRPSDAERLRTIDRLAADLLAGEALAFNNQKYPRGEHERLCT